MVSLDDYPLLGCFPPRLTTIELSKYELRDTAVQLLLERVEGKRTRAKTVTLQPQLRVLASPAALCCVLCSNGLNTVGFPFRPVRGRPAASPLQQPRDGIPHGPGPHLHRER